MNATWHHLGKRSLGLCLIVGCLAVAVGPVRGEESPAASDQTTPEFSLELKDSTRVRGQLLNLDPLILQTDFGQAVLPLRLIGTVELAGEAQNCVVHLLNGDRLTGRLAAENVSIRTSYGELAIPIDEIVRMVSSAAPPEKKTAATNGGDAFTLVTADNWEKLVLRRQGTTLVLFTSSTRKVCQEVIPLMARVHGATHSPIKVHLTMVDVDRSSDLAKSLGVSEVPFAIVYENGSETEREAIELAELQAVVRGRESREKSVRR